MGGKIPRKIKEKVICEWLQGISRETIAKNNGISVGTVTNIIKEASLQEEYHDIDLLRQLAVIMRENGLEPVIVGFAVRLLKITEDNGIDLNQIEPIISDFATYCFKHELPFDTLIMSGYQALSLEKELGVPVKMLSEHITQAREIRDDLLDKSQKELRKLQEIRTEYELFESKIKEFKDEDPLIAPKIELKEELEKTRKELDQCKQIISDQNREISERGFKILGLEGAIIELKNQLGTTKHQMSWLQDKVKVLEKELAKNHE